MPPPGSFNILDYRMAFQLPARLTDVDSWHAHIPFAFFSVELLAPALFVELGTWKGDSYCAFLQGVATLGLPTRCFAVDTWTGDEHTGSYDEAVLEDLRRHHDPLYEGFSSLLQMPFDDALERFDDGSIDLIHIDGCHTYEAVSHDFNAWLPKLSSRGVVLLHDTNEQDRGFGVWRLWEELKGVYPGFSFAHGHGLGVLGVGAEFDGRFLSFLAEAAERPTIPELFRSLGNRIKLIGRERRLVTELTSTQASLAASEATASDVRAELDRTNTELDRTNAERDSTSAELDRTNAELDRTNAELSDARSHIDQQRSDLQVLAGHEAALNAAYGSLSWRVTSPLRRTKDLLRRSSLARRIYARVRRSRSRAEEPSEEQRGGELPASRAERTYLPLVSVVMPVFNTDPRLLRHALKSVLGQSYPGWELCICDDGTTDRATTSALEEIARSDPRVLVTTADSNDGIASATNRALSLATGLFVAFLDHDDELAPEALDDFVTLLNERPETDVIYSDEDKIDSGGQPRDPHFKPDWSPEFFRGVMYVGHLLMVRRSLIEEVGRLDPAFDGVQDYELMLRLSERTDRIEHIPKVLYRWRATPGSLAMDGDAKKGISELQAAAVNAHLERCAVPAVARPSPTLPHRVELHGKPRRRWPSVSIVIPTKDAPDEIGRCLESIFAQTSYPDFEVVVVDSGTSDPRALEILESHPVHVVALEGRFNFSRANNLGVASANGKHVILLNNDTEVLRPDWIETLVWHVELHGVGAVGPLLVYRDGSVQHAGVVLGARGTADHAMLGFPSDVDGYAGSLACTREVSAVTAACMIVQRDVYASLGGLSEDYRTHYQDVDFCLRLRNAGLRVLFTPRTRLLHDQGVSRGDFYDHIDRALLLDVWGDLITRGDPYYSRHLSRERLDYSLAS